MADERLRVIIRCSVDDTWQTRGFVSSLGVVTVIAVDTGKALVQLCPNHVQDGYMDIVKDIHHERYNDGNHHKCNLNYRGSAPNMEKVRAVTMFGHSVLYQVLR